MEASKNFMEMNCKKSLERSNLKLCYLKFKMRSGVILCATDALVCFVINDEVCILGCANDPQPSLDLLNVSPIS